MVDTLFDKAEQCIDEDDVKQAIILFEKSLKKGNIESALRLGTIYLDCYQDLDLEEPNYEKAIQYLKVGAECGHIECQKILGELLSQENQKFSDFKQSILWLLKSGTSDSEEIEKIKKLIKKFLDNNQQSTKDVKNAIKVLEDYIKITHCDNLRKFIIENRNVLVLKIAKKEISESKTCKELILRFSYFRKYMEKDY